MELSKGFFQATTTVFLGLTLGMGGFIFFSANPGSFAFASSSQRITLAEAQRLQAEYLSHKPLRVKYTDNAGHDQRGDLKGFTFDAAHLHEIINNNASGTNADEVYFSFGQDGTFNEGPLGIYKRPNLRIIAIGVRNGQLLTTGASPSIFDKADPCPPNCPR